MLARIRRDAVAITAALSALISVIGLMAHLSSVQEGSLVGLATLILGFVAMIGVSAADQLVPAAVGVLKALGVAAVSFGLHLDPALVAALLVFAEAAGALLMRVTLVSAVSWSAIAPSVPPVE